MSQSESVIGESGDCAIYLCPWDGPDSGGVKQVGTLQRRNSDAPKGVWLAAQNLGYPQYYLNNFHYQVPPESTSRAESLPNSSPS